MKFSRIISLFLSLLVVAGSFTFYASAEDYVVENVGDSITDLAKYVDVEKFEADLRTQALAFEKSVDLTKFNIPFEGRFVNVVLKYMREYMPDLFHVESFTAWGSTYFSRFEFKYNCTKEEFEVKKSAFDKAVSEMLEGVVGNDSLGETEKALLLHDRLALKCEYDYTFSKRTAYDSIVEGISVCEGYTKGYMYLLEKVGIKSEYCSSNTLNHAWNIVYIDGVPYHVDVTWDDPSWCEGGRGISGYVSHENFLRSTNGIKETGHEATDFITTPVDTRYDKAFWADSETSFVLAEGEIYYLDKNTGNVMSYKGKEVVATVSGLWMLDEEYYWIGNFGKLSSDGENLYYSDPKTVYKYDLSSKKEEALKTITDEGFISIYGMEYIDGYIYCDLNTAPFGDVTYLSRISIELPKEEPSEIVLKDGSYLVKENGYILGMKEKTTVSQLLSMIENTSAVVRNAHGEVLDSSAFCGTGCTLSVEGGESVTLCLLGDVDGSGIVDSTDYMRLKNAFMGAITLEGVNQMAADVLHDGKIDATDYLRIKSYFLGVFDLYA